MRSRLSPLSSRAPRSILVAGPDDRTLHNLGVVERTLHGKDAQRQAGLACCFEPRVFVGGLESLID